MVLLTTLLLGALVPNVALSDDVNVDIINGTEAKPHSRPYMVSVQNYGIQICGGFLVSNRGEKLTVVMGAHDLTKSSSIHMAVKFYHIYPEYAFPHNDIMLLQLDGVVEESPSITWIPINQRRIRTNSICSVSGWRKKTFSEGTSAVLMEVKCHARPPGERFIQQRGWCVPLAWEGTISFLQGDSGGPLVCNKMAIGIVSFFEKGNCDHPTRRNVYTKISKFLPWIIGIIYSK